ncbi:DUF2755 family protein [Mangrovibacter plantisponsor]|uniref:Uncharacterized protein DUF2755 n=1 Tax=Mangrovibacter plantisponsor TaxID=451513 RepID=A0A317PKK2_9ENTR|nr:DUF2755 family protein [Mangrovibacter plantisponsor]PWW01277.1 uncharacterized protein DUF2755 [Mangrovibacter plantisponsor]
MTDLPIRNLPRARPKATLPGNIAYAVFVLFCFWVGSHLLNMLSHSQGIFEHLLQTNNQTDGPAIEMSMLVSTIFGLVPVLAGGFILAVLALVFKLRRL